MLNDIVPQIPRTPQEVYDLCCPQCGSPTHIAWHHVGGLGKEPHLVCTNSRDGECKRYDVCRISTLLLNAYLDWLTEKVGYVRQSAVELPLPHSFATLEDIINRCCPTCGGSYGMITGADGRDYVRCSNPTCCRYCILYPITPELAREYNEFVLWLETEYGAMEEASQ